MRATGLRGSGGGECQAHRQPKPTLQPAPEAPGQLGWGGVGRGGEEEGLEVSE